MTTQQTKPDFPFKTLKKITGEVVEHCIKGYSLSMCGDCPLSNRATEYETWGGFMCDQIHNAIRVKKLGAQETKDFVLEQMTDALEYAMYKVKEAEDDDNNS